MPDPNMPSQDMQGSNQFMDPNMIGGQQQSEGQASDYERIISMVSDIDRRIRVLEERYMNLRKKLQLSDQNLLESERSFSKELRVVNEDSINLKREISDFSEKIDMFGSELSGTAKKSDMMAMEKYLYMWSPTNFVTRNQLKTFLKSKGVITDVQSPAGNDDSSSDDNTDE
jgi:hypothetical protein